MSLVKKGCSLTLLIAALSLVGIVFGFRSCLSKYDERSALPPAVYFENDTSSVLFSLIKYSKATSYSSQRGMTHKTVTNYYHLQSNDAISGKKINSIEVTDDLKNYPAEILGAEGNHAWVFIDELMAFDPFTLEKIADVQMIEAKNPSLKGMMPKESEYYKLNDEGKGIIFITNDGAQWIIQSKTLDAKPYEQPADPAVKTIAERVAKQLMDHLKDIQKQGLDFNQSKVNQDTFNHQWLGLYSKQEIETLNKQLSFTPKYGPETRRQFYNATYDSSIPNSFKINGPTLQNSTSGSYYLNGGFLTDKQTAKAIHLQNPSGFLLIHKTIIGENGEIIISRISTEGKEIWKLNTGVKKWVDYKFTGNRLFLFINDNKEVDSSDCTVFLIIDCTSGKVKKYDYFNEKTIK